jgi:hypothetical protein
MKKIILLASLYLLTILVGLGQTSSGTLLLGAGFNFEGQQYQAAPSNTYSDTPYLTSSKIGGYSATMQAGKFIRDNLVVGLAGNHSATEFKISYSRDGSLYYDHTHTLDFSVGPFIRKYILVTDKFFFFSQGSTGLSFGNTVEKPDPGSGNSSYKTKSLGAFAKLSPGVTYFITPKIGLDLTASGLSYDYIKYSESDINAHHVDLGLDLASLNYGLRFYFAR